MLPSAEAKPELLMRQDAPPIVSITDPDQGWIDAHAAELRAAMTEHGALLVRGLGVRTAADVRDAAVRLGVTPMIEREAFATRRKHIEGVYASSEWPPDQPMCMHHELSYLRECPSTLLFGCLRAPGTGGVTALADSREVLAALPVDLVDRFRKDGWMLTRTFNGEVGVSLTEAFGTEDRAEVTRYLADNDIDGEWLPSGELRTRQRRPAVLRDPVTGDEGWFNQVAFLNEWTMEPEIREYLVLMYSADGLPFNTRYGDGSPIEPETVQIINQVYESKTLREPWQTGDLLLVDNLRAAHSREPYTGDREIAVLLGDPVPVV